MGKVIWYLHPYAGAPVIGMAYRPYFLAKNLDSKGCKTFIISSSFHHLLHKKITQTNSLAYIDSVNYYWIKNITYHSNGIKRLLNMFIYSFKLLFLFKIPKNVLKPNVIVASSPHLFHILPAYALAKRFKAQFIVEIRDIWPESLIQIGNIFKYHPIILFLRLLEVVAYKKADRIVSVLPGFNRYLKKFAVEHKFVYIPNGVDCKSFKLNVESALYKEISSYRDKFILLYSGAIGKPNALGRLVEAMQYLQDYGYNHIIAIIIGEGTEKKLLMSKIREKKCDNIKFYQSVNRDILQSTISLVDCCYIGWLNLPLYNYGISANKIFEYMVAGKPIVQVANLPRMFDIVTMAHCGVTVQSDLAQAIAKAILDMASLSKIDRRRIGMNGKHYVEKYHNYKLLADKYMNI